MSDLPGLGLLIGLSGGLDSTVLLHLLAASPACRERGLRAIHVHHGLHADADDWATHCRELCARIDVPLQVTHVEVARDTRDGPEAAARAARHDAFAAAMREGDILVLAQHHDDQAETFLLRALRASGPDGLAAMRPWRRHGRGWLWRPLLSTPRSDLLAYARQHGLHWIDDPSNDDTTLDRNFLRHHVLPVLRERWPQADAGFARSAALCAQAGDLLDAEDAQALAHAATDDPHVLSTKALRALPAARRARVLRRWIDRLGLPPLPGNGVAMIEADLLTARTDANAAFAWHGAVVQAWRDLLHAGHARAPLPTDWQATWDGRAPLPLPGTGALVLVADTADGHAAGFDRPVTVHARRGGERMQLPHRRHGHALKKLLQDRGVPPWLRERLPLLSDDSGTLLAAGDMLLSDDFAAWLHARGLRLAWEPVAGSR